MILNGTGYDIPNNSWDFADIGLANGIPTTKSVVHGLMIKEDCLISQDFNTIIIGKYLVSAMIRRDASTKFGPDNSVAYFPSTTLGWIISEEDFMDGLEKVDFLKIRLVMVFLDQIKLEIINTFLNSMEKEHMF